MSLSSAYKRKSFLRMVLPSPTCDSMPLSSIKSVSQCRMNESRLIMKRLGENMLTWLAPLLASEWWAMEAHLTKRQSFVASSGFPQVGALVFLLHTVLSYSVLASCLAYHVPSSNLERSGRVVGRGMSVPDVVSF